VPSLPGEGVGLTVPKPEIVITHNSETGIEIRAGTEEAAEYVRVVMVSLPGNPVGEIYGPGYEVELIYWDRLEWQEDPSAITAMIQAALEVESGELFNKEFSYSDPPTKVE